MVAVNWVLVMVLVTPNNIAMTTVEGIYDEKQCEAAQVKFMKHAEGARIAHMTFCFPKKIQ